MNTRAILGLTVLAASLGALLACVVPSPARAQTAKDESVTQRPRAEFDPLGIELDELLGAVGLLSRDDVEGKTTPFASFTVQPKLNGIGRWDSNIFRVESGAIGDFLGILTPSVTIASDWENHALTGTVSADIGRWRHVTTEDYEDLHVTVGGALDVLEAFKATGTAKLERLHEARGGIDDPGAGVRPLTFWQPSLTLGAEYFADAILLRPGIEITQLNYDPAEPIGATLTAPDTKLRDRTDVKLKNRFGYEFQPGTVIFVEPSYTRREFRRARDASGFLQSSRIYQVLTGLTWDVSSVTFLDAGVGFLSQQFDDSRYESVNAPAFSLTGIWNATDLLTVTTKGESYTGETTQGGTSSVLIHRLSFEVAYEALDNLIATWTSTGELDTFEQQEPPKRQDIRYATKFGLDYLIGRNLTAGIGVGWEKLDSNSFGHSWVTQTGEIRLGLRL